MSMTLRALVFWLCMGSAVAFAQTAVRNPAWSQLTPDQQRILAPIETEWDTLEPRRKLKWLGIAKRFPQMSAEKQARLNDQMRDWVALSYEERRAARERYMEIEKLSVAERQQLLEKWDEYQRASTQRNAAEPSDAGGPADATPAHPQDATPAADAKPAGDASSE